MTSVISCNSPLVWDQTMLEAMRVYCRSNQAVLCSPFVLGGANTPASTVAAVAQLNAEALAGIAYGQLVGPGSPTVYGHYLATVSMKSGAPMAGTPEIAMMNFIIGQLARRYDLPWRSTTHAAGSKVFDAQSGYESASTGMAVLLSGANFMWHAAGWDEAGLVACFAKFVVDAEQCEMLYRLGQGPQFGDFDDALAAVREVGPGGHYLGAAHTLEHFQSAFFMSELFDNNSYEQWKADGAKDACTRALEKARQLLADYEQPSLDPAIDESLQAFIRKRQSEIPENML
jgi:trimethylamine--corrinoid protein Co-methyltransferase